MRSALLLLALLSVAATSLAEEVTPQLITALERRYQKLDRLRIQYDWYECRVPLDKDPFEKNNWLVDDFSHTLHYEALILRPHYCLAYSGPFANQKRVQRAWVDGEFISKQLEDDGSWSYTRDNDRWLTTGPLPVMTPLEMWQVFDIRDSLLDLLKSGKLHVVHQEADSISVAGDKIYERPFDWRLSAVFDESRDYLPTEMAASLMHSGGTIKWQLKTLAPVAINETHAIGEAILALSNEAVNADNWQVYHYVMVSVEQINELTAGDLRPSFPDSNARVLDEIALEYREVDRSGAVVKHEQWTPEQRSADRAAIQTSVAMYEKSKGIIAERRFALMAVLAGSTTIAIAVFAYWRWWKRRATR